MPVPTAIVPALIDKSEPKVSVWPFKVRIPEVIVKVPMDLGSFKIGSLATSLISAVSPTSGTRPRSQLEAIAQLVLVVPVQTNVPVNAQLVVPVNVDVPLAINIKPPVALLLVTLTLVIDCNPPADKVSFGLLVPATEATITTGLPEVPVKVNVPPTICSVSLLKVSVVPAVVQLKLFNVLEPAMVADAPKTTVEEPAVKALLLVKLLFKVIVELLAVKVPPFKSVVPLIAIS